MVIDPQGKYYPTSIQKWYSNYNGYRDNVLVMWYLDSLSNVEACHRAFFNIHTFELEDNAYLLGDGSEYTQRGFDLSWYIDDGTYSESYFNYRIQYFNSDGVLGWKDHGPFYIDNGTNGVDQYRRAMLSSTGVSYASYQDMYFTAKGDLPVIDEWNSGNYVSYSVVSEASSHDDEADGVNILRILTQQDMDVTSASLPLQPNQVGGYYTSFTASDYSTGYRRLVYARPFILNQDNSISEGPFIGIKGTSSSYDKTIDIDTVASYLGENAEIGIWDDPSYSYRKYAINYKTGNVMKIEISTGEIMDSWEGSGPIPYTMGYYQTNRKSIFFNINWCEDSLLYTGTNLRRYDGICGHLPGHPYNYGTSLWGITATTESSNTYGGCFSCGEPVNSYVSVDGGVTWHDTGYPISNIMSI